MTTQSTRPARVYVGNGKAARSGNPVNFSVDLDQLREAIASGAAQTYQKKNGHTCVKLTIWSNGEEPDQYGNTHSVCLDNFVPTPRPEGPTADSLNANPLPF